MAGPGRAAAPPCLPKLPLIALCLPLAAPSRPQRPSYLETAIRGVPGGGSVKDHFLTQVGGWVGRGQGEEAWCNIHAGLLHAHTSPLPAAVLQYQKAIAAVVAAQFGRKASSAGKEGVLSLTQQRGGALG